MGKTQIVIMIGVAGLGEGYPGDTHSPWASAKPRSQACLARSVVRRGSESA